MLGTYDFLFVTWPLVMQIMNRCTSVQIFRHLNYCKFVLGLQETVKLGTEWIMPLTSSCTLWNYYLLISLQLLAPWASFLLVTQTSFSCASEEFLLFFRIIFTMTCIHFLKYWTSGAKWGGREEGHCLGALRVYAAVVYLQPFVNRRMGSWGMLAFLAGVSILGSLPVPFSSVH